MSNLLFIDTETGGLNPEKHSLLSVALIVFDGEKILDKNLFYVKEDNYFCTEDALKINNLKLEYVKRHAVDKQEIITCIENLKRKFFNGEKITLAGQNVHFDYSFLKKMYADENADFSEVFSYRVLDISSVMKFLFLANLIPQDISALDDAIKFFNIPIFLRHSALDDCEAALEVFRKLLDIIKN